MSRYVMEPPGHTVGFDKLAEMLVAAQSELSELCHGKRFRMCVPVDDADSDIVIGDALRHAHALVVVLQQRSDAATTPAAVDPSGAIRGNAIRRA